MTKQNRNEVVCLRWDSAIAQPNERGSIWQLHKTKLVEHFDEEVLRY